MISKKGSGTPAVDGKDLNLDIKCRYGEMAERTKAPVSKTGIPPGIVGSNPTLSARCEAKKRPLENSRGLLDFLDIGLC